MKRVRGLTIEDFTTADPQNVFKSIDYYIENYCEGDGINRCTQDSDKNVTKSAVFSKCPGCNKEHEQVVIVDEYAPIMSIMCNDVVVLRLPHNNHVFFKYTTGDYGLSKLFVKAQSCNVVLDNRESLSGYVWNNTTALWQNTPKKFITPLVSAYFSPLFDAIIGYTLGRGFKPKDKKYEIPKTDRGIDHEGDFISLLLKTRKHVQNASGASQVFTLAAKDLYLEDYSMKLNRIPYLFPVLNKQVVDLKTGVARDRTREDMFSFSCDVELIEGPHTIAKEFYEQIMLKLTYDEKGHMSTATTCLDTVEFMKRYGGYKLTGEMSERTCIIMHGEGSNAKGTVSMIASEIMGKYYHQATKDVFIQGSAKSAGSCTPHIMPCIGARHVNTSETQETDKLNEGFLKGWSHGDIQTVRGLFREQYSFLPTAKLSLETNLVPHFNFEDLAMHDTMVLIPFNARFVKNPRKPNEIKQNKEYAASLLTPININHFFSYYVQGAVEWYAGNKLTPTGIIEAATSSYVNELDDVGNFIEEFCLVGKEYKQTQSSIFDVYRRVYCSQTSKEAMSKSKFFKSMEKKGFKRVKNGSMYILGLQLYNDI
jgi:P4 family phage/plasmid primase-like protien